MLTEQQIQDYENCEKFNLCEGCSMSGLAETCYGLYRKNEIDILKDKLAKINSISVDLQDTQYSQQEVFDKATEIYNLSSEVEE